MLLPLPISEIVYFLLLSSENTEITSKQRKILKVTQSILVESGLPNCNSEHFFLSIDNVKFILACMLFLARISNKTMLLTLMLTFDKF